MSVLSLKSIPLLFQQLFKKVVPHHCLGCIWSQRDKKENKHLAPTIRATISQFNALTKCVVSTILGGKELKTQQRARIIEKWINIAHVIVSFWIFFVLRQYRVLLHHCLNGFHLVERPSKDLSMWEPIGFCYCYCSAEVRKLSFLTWELIYFSSFSCFSLLASFCSWSLTLLLLQVGTVACFFLHRTGCGSVLCSVNISW